MKIYTKGGDEGQTSLWGGRRVSKATLRIEAYGTVDELNSCVGLLISNLSQLDTGQKATLLQVQNDLFVLGSILATDPESSVKGPPVFLRDEAVSELESEIDEMDHHLPELQNFILPGGTHAASVAHLCRTVCRRSERRIVELDQTQAVGASVVKYLNRLSDYFFVLARHLCALEGVSDVKWENPG